MTAFLPLVMAGKNEMEVKELILKHDKAYTDEEANEIYTALLAEKDNQGSGTTDEKKTVLDKPTPAAKNKPKNNRIKCEEWRVEWPTDLKGDRNADNCEQLKLKRKNVKLTEELITQLNDRCNPLNPYKYYITK